MIRLARHPLGGRRLLLVAVLAAASCDFNPAAPPPASIETSALAHMSFSPLTDIQALGQAIFEDRNLSIHRNQSCATCHDAAWGFSAPNAGINRKGAVMQGSLPRRFGARRAPSAAYATQAPVLHFNPLFSGYAGGNFWDGRATGARLGSPAAEQATGPFLNPVEQALPDAACVLYRVLHSRYGPDYVRVFGPAITTIQFPADTDRLCQNEGVTIPLSLEDRQRALLEYDNVGWAIAAFEASPAVNQFSSRHDAAFDGAVMLTEQEQRGLQLFAGKGRCAICHPHSGRHALFTGYSYSNIGVPPNPDNPALLADPSYRDLGIGAVIGDAAADGAHKTPTLRNVHRRPGPGATKAFMHNGVFKSLEQVVHFYNTRDVLAACDAVAQPEFGVNCWPPPEVPRNVSMLLGTSA
jgi:cytochrome c peroxidase